jgi:hypothetical protein
MIEKIYSTEVLKPFLHKTCCENDVSVTFDDDISENDYVIIKVDDYYNSLGLENTLPSPDCLIIRRCKHEGYGMTIVELKDIETSSRFEVDNMIAKFTTCINDFISIRFKDILWKDYKDIKLYFVSNIEIYKRDMGLRLRTIMNVKFIYNDKKYMIQPKMPHPTIKNCY